MIGSKPVDTPMDPNLKVNRREDSTPVQRGSYQRLVGKRIYISHTRPDIAFPVSVVSQHMHSTCEEHLEAVYHILRYLKMTLGLGLHFKKHNNRDLEVYTDSSWAGELTDRQSTSGYCTYVWGNLVTWHGKKQPMVSRSSAKSEYRALALGICEGIWIKRLINELRFDSPESFKMYSDSQAAISIAKNLIQHNRTKHVEIDRHFISEKVNSKIIELNYIATKKQIVDILTKALPRKSFEE
ncbi:secreted RxLR effector protein 161-like [Humulus lupulus]|uniref:secreted RxLR effector protein 161-like n=1 Tax=Humulus lupulus TaxID=3486 RepID=UPI002B403716|nr:secreted RxLR effector protein 161-like [Humulus lupulus]